jgi:hypothetical protein
VYSVWHSGYLCTWLLLCGLFVEFLGELAKLPKATMSFVMSLLFAWNSSEPQTDVREIWYMSSVRNSVEKTPVSLNMKRRTGTLHKEQYTFAIICRSFLLSMRNVSGKCYRGNQDTILLSITFSRKSCRLLHNVEKYCGGGQATDDEMVHNHCMLDN